MPAKAGLRQDQRPDLLWQADPAGADRLVLHEPPQVLGHIPSRLIPTRWLAFNRLGDDRLQVARHPCVDFAQRRGGLAGHFVDQRIAV